MKPSRSRCTVSALVALAVISGAAIGCTPQAKQDGPREKLTFAYPVSGADAYLVHVAFAKGFFAEEGLDATPRPLAFGKLALDEVNAGKADLAAVADTPFVLSVMNGGKITIIGTVSTSDTNHVIYAKRDRGITRPGDLSGKTIGVTAGTSGDFFLYSFLLFHGIDENRIRRVAVNPDEMAEALDTGRVDAVSTWGGVWKRLRRKSGDDAVVFPGEALYVQAFCIAGTREYVDRNPGTVNKVLRALIKAETFVKRHPEEALHLAAEFTKRDRAVLEEMMDIFTYRVVLDQGLLVNLEDQTRWVIKKRLAARTDMPNYLGFIYDNALRSIDPAAVRIVR